MIVRQLNLEGIYKELDENTMIELLTKLLSNKALDIDDACEIVNEYC